MKKNIMKMLKLFAVLAIVSVCVGCSTKEGHITIQGIYYERSDGSIMLDASSINVDYFKLYDWSEQGKDCTFRNVPYTISNLPGNEEYRCFIVAYDKYDVEIASASVNWLVVEGFATPQTVTLEIIHTHENKTDEWSYDDDQHWHEYSCGHTPIKGNHSFVSGVCSVCGYEKCEHYIDYSKYKYDSTHHWNYATCGHDWATSKYTQKSAHDWEEWTVESSCTVEGKTGRTCKVCGYKETLSTQEKLQHDWEEWTTEPTCATVGKTGRTCRVCRRKETLSTIQKVQHTWNSGIKTTAPTCTTEGVATYTCIECGQNKTEAIPATGHTFSTEWSKSASTHWHAAICEHSSMRADSASHTWDSGVETKAPTCVSKGERTFTCTVCGQTKVENINATNVHIWDSGVETTAPRCIATGVATYTCTVCGQNKTEAIPATGHAFSTEWSKDDSRHWHNCENCTQSTGGQTHTWDTGVETKAPTCTDEGIKIYTCTICGQTKTEAITKISHSYVDYRCSVCGEWGQGPTGGYVFYDCDADNDSGNTDGLISTECGWRYLEACPYHGAWYLFGYYRTSSRGNILEIGGTKTSVGTGKANTELLVNAMGENAYKASYNQQQADEYAAKYCANRSITVDGVVYDDWFLPSKDELNLIYVNLHQNGLGSFKTSYPYWSSSEYNGNKACVQSFFEGDQRYSERSSILYICPIRAFN